MQGVCSYTVTAESKVFQFRDENSILDMEILSFAKAVHPDFVASCTYLGTIGDPDLRPVHIYEMEFLPGTAHVLARIPPGNLLGHRNTIMDLARYAQQGGFLFVRRD
ncbi:hypothetical protein BDW74DRAFT_147736 [Aspergillus multicolor]|uniref:uncharacterized protein n=1 Tax=Aspergillus multicolor TaxID=41759 RepID=UPI003CCD0F16